MATIVTTNYGIIKASFIEELIMYVVYRMLCIETGESYIGCSKSFESRMRQHKSAAKQGKPNKIYKAIREYGFNNFIVSILYESDNKGLAEAREAEFIGVYDSFNNGLNSTHHGKGGSSGRAPWNKGVPRTQAQKEHHSKMITGRKASAETKKKMSDSRKGDKHHYYGKTFSDEHKLKLSESHKGYEMPQSQKDAISDGLQGREHTWGSKISDAMKGFKHKQRECPYCGKVGGGGNMARYHFDNCKESL